MPTYWRHSLFFQNVEEADKAEGIVASGRLIENEVVDVYQSNDGDTGIIEVRFFTEAKIGERDMRDLLNGTKTENYALNCDDYL